MAASTDAHPVALARRFATDVGQQEFPPAASGLLAPLRSKIPKPFAALRVLTGAGRRRARSAVEAAWSGLPKREELGMCKVLNARQVGTRLTADRVYVGRPSKWGNPFVIGRDGTRDQVIAKYRAWLMSQPALLAELHELRGQNLVCWCAPQRCHGDVLAELANR